MSEKQKKILVGLDILELILSIIGFITCCMVFALTRIAERYFFYMIAIYLGINIVNSIKKIDKEKSKVRVVKYSKKLITAKNIKKVSY